MTELKHIDIYTDGACSGNPGKGGWGAILKYKNNTKEISGSDSDTTNNRMELTAVIRALQKLKYACEVTVYTDSMYVSNAFKKGWFWQWKKNNWLRTGNKEILNKDLWEELDKLLKIHKVTFEWVKGHAGHPENEKCDELATTAIKNIA